MEMSDEKTSFIKKEYNDFKKTSRYIERKDQLTFVDFARTILEKVLQKKSLTNEQLTALIQIFGHGSRKENIVKYIDVLNFGESDSKDLIKIYVDLGQTGFTGRGKATIKGLSSEQLSIVHRFLVNILESNSEKSMKEIVSKFEQMNIPQVKYGVYSPWLYYLHPTMCPIVAGPVKYYLKEIGWDQNNYLDAWDMLKQIKQVTKENNYGFLDAFIYKSISYWLFIVPHEFRDGELWNYCKENSVAAMHYLEESDDKKAPFNRKQIKKIRLNDKVIVYLNNNTIGGIGEVSNEFYEDISDSNGFDGDFGQRIGLKWLTNNFEINFKLIKPYLKKFPKHLGLKTIYDINEDDFNTIFKFVNKGIIGNGNDEKLANGFENGLLLNKKQMIFYGPPGTGKTYKAREIAVDFIEKLS